MQVNSEDVMGRAVYNIRERQISVSYDRAAPAIERLAGEDSPIWPVSLAGPMVMEPSLEVGASGGHAYGLVNYHCVELRPGHRATFRFEPGDDPENGMVGFHYLEIVQDGDGIIARHVVMAEMRGEAHHLWFKEALNKRHDRAVDKLFDRLTIFAQS